MAKRRSENDDENEDEDESEGPPPFRVEPVSPGPGRGASPSAPSAQQIKFAGWVAFAIIAIIFLAKTFRIEEVRGDQIGFLVNNWTGAISEVREAGNVVFCGLWNDFHAIENRNLSIDMGAEAGKGDYVKLKTLDGNDVYVDFTIFYQVDPAKASLVLAENGPGAAYERHWVRDYGRAIVRYVFGELTTEKFYVAEERDRKMRAAEKELNVLLEPHGIRVTQIAVQSFRYHTEYEKKITEKKLADQEVEEFRSKKAANEESQARRILQGTQEMQNVLTRFKGELDQRVEEAQGQADRLRRQAEGYAKRVTLEAEANFHKQKNEAEGLRARLEAEAAGQRALREAMEGEGGRNLVALEYAKKLAGVKVTGRPILIEGEVKQFRHQNQPDAAGGAAAGAGATTGGKK